MIAQSPLLWLFRFFTTRVCRPRLVGILALGLAVCGCGLFGDDDERQRTRKLTEGQLYERIQELLEEENYRLAVENLQLLESRYPFGVYAEQSQLEIIYAYFRSGDEAAAVAAAERFLRLHPDHINADYAWYMQGLANYSLKPGLLSRFYEADYATRDIEPSRQSFREFEQFLRFFPESPYAADARVRMVNIKHALARHELYVANYYIKRKAYVAAINRAKSVIEQYPRSESIDDALALLAFTYYQSDLPELAQTQIDVLKHNFPEHWSIAEDGQFRFKEDFDPYEKSLLNRVSFGLLDAPSPPTFYRRDE